MICTHCGREIKNKSTYCQYCGTKQMRRKSNRLSMAGLLITLVSIALGMITVKINTTGFYFQYFFSIPIFVGLILSIIGTFQAKKTGRGLVLGAAGVVIAAGLFIVSALYFVLMYGFSRLFFVWAIIFII